MDLAIHLVGHEDACLTDALVLIMHLVENARDRDAQAIPTAMPRSLADRSSATNAPLATLIEIAIEPEALSSVVAELKMYANAAEPAGSGWETRRATAATGESARTAGAAAALASAATYSLRWSG